MVNNATELFQNLNADSLGKIEDLFSRYGGVHLLNEWETPSSYSKRTVKVWRLNVLLGKREIILDLLFGQNFPFAPPKVVWVNCPKFLTYPHVEEDGSLCLLSNAASIASNYPERIVIEIIDESLKLIEENIAETNLEDFQTEFNSYWNRLLTDKQEKFINLIKLDLASRIIYSARVMGRTFLAETPEALRQWIKNRYQKNPEIIEPAGIIHISTLPLPKEYPKTSRDVYSIVKKHSAGGTQILQELAKKSPKHFNVLVISESQNGKVLAGVRICAPEASDLSRGFRPKWVPATVVLTRYLLSGNLIGRYEVERMDASWIYGRDSDPQLPKLSASKIILIGCGSIGSHLAKLLATSGIGKIYLIDPELLTSANIGRHYLGAKYVGQFKAESLKNELQENYPHLQIEAENRSWQKALSAEPQSFADASLIISSTGSWESDAMLNLWQNNIPGAPPILYGWTEAFAVAGHALTVFPGIGCLQCGRDEYGRPVFKVADFNPEDTLRQEPACGITYQPYGAAELSNTVSLISQTAIDIIHGKTTKPTHNIWIGPLKNITQNSGKLTLEAQVELDSNNYGAVQISRSFPASDKCTVCKKVKIQNA